MILKELPCPTSYPLPGEGKHGGKEYWKIRDDAFERHKNDDLKKENFKNPEELQGKSYMEKGEK